MRSLLIIAAAAICASSQARAQNASWHYQKEDPTTKKHIVQIDAQSFEPLRQGNGVFRLHDMTMRLYDNTGSHYKQISSKQAIVDEKLGTLMYGPDLKTMIRLASK